MFTKSVRPAVALLLLMTVLCGLIYPIVITGIARVLFPAQAAGSLIHADGKLVGSRLIGQNFTNPGYFWGRPSATTPQAYNGIASTGSNLGPSNPALIAQVRGNAARLRNADPTNRRPIPADLVTASASGLDPQISRAAADYQAARVAKARSLPIAQVSALVQAHTEHPALGFLGEQRVNVLELNLALDTLHRSDPAPP